MCVNRFTAEHFRAVREKLDKFSTGRGNKRIADSGQRIAFRRESGSWWLVAAVFHCGTFAGRVESLPFRDRGIPSK
jgi:hypothetical protein